MEDKDDNRSSLKIREGVTQPPSVNPDVFTSGVRKRKKYSVNEYVKGIRDGDRAILSRAITLIESSLDEHKATARSIIEKCLPYSSRSVRIGITGVPGAGKSTFIETFGLYSVSMGRKVAVLAIDPSSQHSKGSILGDKTRMERLGNSPDAFIRPSPSAGTLGGVARKTRETIILCEAAGFDTIIVETVGVGQSETAVRSMVDFFLLLMLTGAGDEIQGIKRGIMEMADAIAINKADGENRLAAEKSRIMFQNVLSLFPSGQSGWKPLALTCSALDGSGIKEIWDLITGYADFTVNSGYFEELRRQQSVVRMQDVILDSLSSSFYGDDRIKALIPEIEKELGKGALTSYRAAEILLDKYFSK